MRSCLAFLAFAMAGAWIYGATQDPAFVKVVAHGSWPVLAIAFPTGTIWASRKYGALKLVKRGLNGAFAAAWTVGGMLKDAPGEFHARYPEYYTQAKESQ